MAGKGKRIVEGLLDKLGGKIQKETGKVAGDKDQIRKGEKDLARGEEKTGGHDDDDSRDSRGT